MSGMKDPATKIHQGIQYAATVLDTVGNTPLVQLSRLAHGYAPLVLAKVESFNPGRSVKDRIGIHMVEKAEQAGTLTKGGTIVEATSGNTGLGLAMAAALKGYRCVCVMPDKASQEKRDTLKAYGARVVICPTNVPADSPDSYYEVARRLSREIPSAILANQYFNPDNPEAHYLTTGPEIWEQTAGKLTHFVAGVGTGGTISGTGKFLKEKNPNVQIVGADPVGSILAHYHRTGEMCDAHSYLIEGIGEDIIPGNVHFEYIDEMVTITDREAYQMTRRLSREEGLFSGSSAGCAVAAALKVAARLGPEAVMVVLLPDTGDRYLSKAHSDAWLSDNGLLEPEEITALTLLRMKKSQDLPALLTVRTDEPVRVALGLIRRHNISQVPVLDAVGQVVGTVQEPSLMEKLIEGSALLEQPLSAVMEAPLPRIGAEESLSHAARSFAHGVNAVLVEENGRVVGILSRIDLIGYVAK